MVKYAKIYDRNEEDSPDLAFQKQLLAIISFILFLCGVAWWLMWYFIFGLSIPTIAAGLFGIMVFVMIIIFHNTKNHWLFFYSFFLCTIIVSVVCNCGYFISA